MKGRKGEGGGSERRNVFLVVVVCRNPLGRPARRPRGQWQEPQVPAPSARSFGPGSPGRPRSAAPRGQEVALRVQLYSEAAGGPGSSGAPCDSPRWPPRCPVPPSSSSQPANPYPGQRGLELGTGPPRHRVASPPVALFLLGITR